MVFDWRMGAGQKLDKSYPIELTGFSDRLLLLAPIENDWAVIGARDKYLSPMSVKSVTTSSEKLTAETVEGGPLVIWSGKGTPTTESIVAKDLGNGFWQFDLPVTKDSQSITLTR